MSAPSLEDAIALAAHAHRGQLDKAGNPYILHPIRVMLRLQGNLERMVGILHDVVEDTPLTLAKLRELGYGEEVLAAVDALSRREGETYESFIERLAPNATARQVKLADLDDNMDLTRLSLVTDADRARMDRYRAARERLVACEAGRQVHPTP